jgi:hypothetical protein
MPRAEPGKPTGARFPALGYTTHSPYATASVGALVAGVAPTELVPVTTT